MWFHVCVFFVFLVRGKIVTCVAERFVSVRLVLGAQREYATLLREQSRHIHWSSSVERKDTTKNMCDKCRRANRLLCVITLHKWNKTRVMKPQLYCLSHGCYCISVYKKKCALDRILVLVFKFVRAWVLFCTSLIFFCVFYFRYHMYTSF